MFRFPRREMGATLLTAELRVLPVVAGRVTVLVPDPQFVAEAGAAFRWPFAGYRFVPGETACRLELDDAARTRLAAPLGSFLRELHAIPPHHPGIRGDTHGRMALARRVRMTTERLTRLEARGWIEGATRFAPLLTAPPPDARPCLVHGDLYARHIVVDDGDLSGIIDWGDAHFGEPACDLGIAWTFLPEAARDAFLEAYGAVSEATRARAIARALHHGAGLADFAFDTNEPFLMAESRRLFRQIAAAHPRIR